MVAKIFNNQGRRLPTPEEDLDTEVFVKRCGRTCELGRRLALYFGAYQLLKEQNQKSKEYDS